MSIKTETSYGNISWKGSTGCSLIGITGKEKSGTTKYRLSLGLFLFIFCRKGSFYVLFIRWSLLTCFSFFVMNWQAELHPG